MIPRRPSWWLGYLDIPYRFRGASRAEGLDCWGLYRLVLAEVFGVAVDDFGAIPMANRVEASAVIESELPGWVRVSWEEGAGALFNVAGEPLHIGICTAKRGTVLHTTGAGGTNLLDYPRSKKWEERFDSCYLPRAHAQTAQAQGLAEGVPR